MATFPCKSNKRRQKKKKNQYLAHMTKTLVICEKDTYYKKNLHTITSKQYAAKSLQKLSKGHKSANIWCTVTSK